MRLNKFIAHNFGLSRREADMAIEGGHVKVNNNIARLGQVVNELNDNITFNNKKPEFNHSYSYVLMNKPVGYVCSRRKQGNAPTIYDLLPLEMHNLKVAGRLDKDSCGLILLTDDGDKIFKLTHPSFQKKKIYHIKLNKPLESDDLNVINGGVKLEDGTSNMKIEPLSNQVVNQPIYKVTMSEGRNRQIRRTLKTLQYNVTHLERISFGPYNLNQLGAKSYSKILAN